MKKLYKNPWHWYHGLKKVGITILTFFGAVQGLNAQVSGYIFSQSTGTYSSIASSGTLVTGSDATTSTTNDTTGWSVTIPFNFNFNGTDYTSVYVNSNGGATFGATTSTSSGVISATTTYSGAVAAMNRDLWGVFITSGVTTSGSNIITSVASFKGIEVGKALNNVNGIPTGATVTAFDETAGTITMSAAATSSSSAAVVRYGSGKIFTSTIGTAPNRVFVVEWTGYNDYGTTVALSNHLNFQLRLAETTNTVSVVYGPSYNIYTTARTNQIGLRGASNSDFNNRTGADGNSWNSTSAGTANSATVSRDNANFPAPGLTFAWAPPTCFAPSALTVATASITATGATASWTAPSTAPANGYEVYYSTSSTAPTSSTVLNATNSVTSTTVSAPISGLLPATTYYVWVRSACVGTDRSVWTAVTSFTTLATCFVPTALTVATASITPTGATASWTAPSTAPSTGYEVYYSTSSTAPTSSTVLNATNSVTSTTTSAPISGLLPSTNYYVWVRSACIGTDRSVWSAVASFRTLCQPPVISNTTGATVCGASGSATISATADAGAVITWYSALTNGTVLGTGNSYTTPVISANTTYYVSAKSNGGTGSVGPVNPAALGSVSSTNYAIGTYYQIFDVITPTTLISVDVFPTSSTAIGTASAVEIRDSSGATLISVPYTVAVNDGTTAQTVVLNYALGVGTGYRIGQGVAIYLNRNTAGATYPFTSSAINVTGNNFSSGPNYWYYIYNWQFSSSCESARLPVTVTVNSACLGTSETSGKEEIKVYPNPFKDVLNISDVNNVKSVSVMDIAGRLVKTFDKPDSTLHLGELNSGMYLVVLNMKDGSKQTIKAIKK